MNKKMRQEQKIKQNIQAKLMSNAFEQKMAKPLGSRHQDHDNIQEKPNIIMRRKSCKQDEKNIHQSYRGSLKFESHHQSQNCSANKRVLARFSKQSDQLTCINKFSDIRKQNLEPSPICRENYEARHENHCQNHQNQAAKFYIVTNENKQKSELSYFCLDCSINLSKMNFKLFPIKQHSKGHLSPEIQTLSKFFQFKNIIAQHSQALKNESKLEQIESSIRTIEEKYMHLIELLQKIKYEEIMALQNIKMSIFQLVSQQEIRYESMGRRVQYLIQQFSKNAKISRKKQQPLNKIYDKSLQKLKKQLNLIKKSGPSIEIVFPKELTMPEVVKKLQKMFDQTVHELSFEDTSKCADSGVVLRSLLFQADSNANADNVGRQQNFHFNSTFGNQKIVQVQGIQCIVSEEEAEQFCTKQDKENVLNNNL